MDATTGEARPGVPSSVDVVVIGAGFAGLYAHYRLRRSGLSIFGFEAAPDVGGTWYWNAYPGARCDTESLDYAYSFSEELLNEWRWSERYATQPEILRYIHHTADRFDLRRDIAFKTRVVDASFDTATNHWELATDSGDRIRCRFLLSAAGSLSTPKPPEIPGLEAFEGRWLQTALWPREPVDFRGKRVAVIGTGSSGIQTIPIVAEQAAHLTVFQRTPNFTLPARNAPADPAYEAKVRADYVAHMRRNRQTMAGNQPKLSTGKSALSVPDEERLAIYENAWTFGGGGMVGVFNDLLTDEAANKTISDFVRRKIRQIVKDPEVAELLSPRDYPLATKRICLDTNYYATFNRPNVTLVDLLRTPIERVTPQGIKTTEAEHPFDIIIFATGFDAMTGPLLAMNLHTSDGHTLQDAWREGPATYLGVTIAGLPNLFVVNGPGSVAVLANGVPTLEHHVDWMADCIDYMRQNGFDRMDVDPAAQAAWAAEVRDVANATLYPRARSWYMGDNVPGKPRVFLAYVGGFANYIARFEAVVKNGYEGLRFSRSKACAQ